ncbi:MAG: PAS-domain containing protein, partial [Bdellovibrionales bacterium]|nr:PAS-domain containing protein [Bdellovibrionales bacterium]
MVHSREVLQTILETLPYSVFWKDRDSVYLGCNKPFAECAGLTTPRDIIGLNDYDLPWKREESDAYRADDALVMQSGVPKLHIIESQKNSAGQFTWLDTSKVPLHDEDGNIFGVLGIYVDITEQKNNEIELIQTKDYLYQAINAITSGFVVYDKDDKFVLCNERYKAMYHEVGDLMVPGIGYRELLEQYVQKKKGLLQKGESASTWVSNRLDRHHISEKDWIQELPDAIVKVSDRRTADGGIVSLRTDITA